MKRKSVLAWVLMIGLLLTGCGGGTGNSELDNENKDTSLDTQEESQVADGSETESEVESETESETETIVEPVISTFTITATGDCALGALQYHEWAASFHQYYDEQGEAYFFANFRDIFEADDMTLINLECVFTDAEVRVEKQFNIKGKESYTGILTSQFVEACTLGNNHSLDYGPESLLDTQNALDAAGVLWAYNDVVSYYTTEDGLKIAIVSASTLASDGDQTQHLYDGVAAAKEAGSNLIIACPLWGVEGDYNANGKQQELAHGLIDAGADLIIGNHPHVLQGIEYYQGKLICYSLGNFSFGANRDPYDKKAGVFQQTFTFIDGELQMDVDAQLIPVRVSGQNTYNNYQPILAQDSQKEEIIQIMNNISGALGGVTFDEEGNISISE